MSHLVSVVLLGLLLLALLVHWSRRSSDCAITIDEFSEAQKGLTTLRWELVQTGPVGRMFAQEDLHFICSQTTPRIQRLFQNERKRLAISWLRHTRQQITRLMDLHLRLASYASDPAPAVELRLAINYLSFIAVCHVLLVLLWLRGPFRVRKIVDYAIAAAHSLCTVFSSRLENINPARLGPVRPRPAGTPTLLA